MSKETPKPSGKVGAAGVNPRRPSPHQETRAEAPKTGRVQFDDRGNAIWEWSVATGKFGQEVSTARLQKLEHPALSLAEDAPTPRDQVKPNPQGTVKGYNPYDSGKLDKKPEPRKKDLHRLSEWLKLKKQATGNRDDD
ncbi:MAG: hypothetical protein ACLPX1_01565 [Steroidobacteraceae bacterium]